MERIICSKYDHSVSAMKPNDCDYKMGFKKLRTSSASGRSVIRRRSSLSSLDWKMADAMPTPPT